MDLLFPSGWTHARRKPKYSPRDVGIASKVRVLPLHVGLRDGKRVEGRSLIREFDLFTKGWGSAER